MVGWDIRRSRSQGWFGRPGIDDHSWNRRDFRQVHDRRDELDVFGIVLRRMEWRLRRFRRPSRYCGPRTDTWRGSPRRRPHTRAAEWRCASQSRRNAERSRPAIATGRAARPRRPAYTATDSSAEARIAASRQKSVDAVVQTVLSCWTQITRVFHLREGGCPQPPEIRRARTRSLPRTIPTSTLAGTIIDASRERPDGSMRHAGLANAGRAGDCHFRADCGRLWANANCEPP